MPSNTANKIYARHKALILYFEKIVGVDRGTAEKDACAVEHVLSEASMDKIAQAVEEQGRE